MSRELFILWANIRYFRPSEFYCKCGCGYGSREADVMPAALLLFLDAVRGELNSPVRVTSGFRCETHNRNVDGAKNSRHIYGAAADITAGNYLKLLSTAQKYNAVFGVRVLPYDDRKFLHIDVSE